MIMDNLDFRKIILEQRKGDEHKPWSGTMIEYLYKVKETPEASNVAPGRIYNMIMRRGTESVDESLKTRGYEDLVRYKFFETLYGDRPIEAIHDLVRFFKAAARRTETGKRILILVGPVSSGKSTVASLLKKGLEMDPTPKYAIKGCPFHEEPLHLIPEKDRKYWQEKLGIRIEGFVCPVCRQMLKDKYTDEEGNVHWEDVPVEAIRFSEQERVGIGTFQPSDPKSQDISELIGSINVSKMTRYGEGDPRSYQFNGELEVANGGMIEYIEILKADTKFHYVLISAAQEQVIKAPRFPQMYIDTLILGHTNQTEFDSFKAEKKNEALHDRMYKVQVPWNLTVDEEVKIYKKLIEQSDFRNIHIAPYTLKIAAEFAVLSRLVKSTKVSSLVEKMKVYNGEMSLELKKQDIDVKALREEGKEQGEGMTGISPRFIINALNVALGMKEDKKCINPIDMIRALRTHFDHQIGVSDDEKKRLMTLLLGEKDSASSEFKELAKKEVNKAFLSAYDEQAQSLFENYVMNAEAYCKKEKIEDSITGEYSDPDEKLMRQIEEHIGVPTNSKGEFRQGIFVYKASQLEKGKEFTFNDYDPLKVAIEKKLMSDLKNVVALTIADKAATDKKTIGRRRSVIKRLKERGFCNECAQVFLSFVGEILRKEE